MRRRLAFHALKAFKLATEPIDVRLRTGHVKIDFRC